MCCFSSKDSFLPWLLAIFVHHLWLELQQEFLDPRRTCDVCEFSCDNKIFQSSQSYEAFSAYGRSKLCNVLHTKELARRLQAERANVTANVLHPGCIDTNVGKAEIPLLRNQYVEGKSEQIIPRASQISYKFVAYNNRLSSSSGSRHERREKNLPTQ
ncbi:unnamed protein product [Sphagnum troendelagicum]|uniref:Uncharacterized protein n=1 Tax=Sphagnum troendelagicum TaxID=128251 RepID=A0ABP0TW25_9BRYO